MKPLHLAIVACMAFSTLYMIEPLTRAQAQPTAPAPATPAPAAAPATPGGAPAPAASPTAPAAQAESDKTASSEAEERSKRQQQEVGKHFHTSSWWVKLKQGGPAAVVQILVSVFGAAFMVERFVNLRRKNLIPAGVAAEARRLWREGKYEDLEKFDDKYPSTLGRAISWVARHRHAPFADISAATGDIISQEIETNHQRAYPLGVVATLEPLIGLLGMILGMITTFETVAMQGALGNPASLADGISEALVTTGLGLAIAIPFLTMFHYFKSVTNSYGSALERELTGLLSEWFLSREAFALAHNHSHTKAPAASAPADMADAKAEKKEEGVTHAH
ncbi:biopolymer transporter ExbB [Verrucomicrobia bacterium LW23]|nr:biopolymer transporter ExbB [Verrucomicrobia bacterium LW23]